MLALPSLLVVSHIFFDSCGVQTKPSDGEIVEEIDIKD